MIYQCIQSGEELSNLVPAFEEAAWQENSPKVLEWVAETSARQAIEESLQAELQRVLDTQKVQEFFKLCEVPGSQVEDYLNKVVKFSDQYHAVLAIRFKSLNPEDPFVDLIAKDFAFTAENISGLLDVTREAFQLFKPKWLRIQLCGQEEPFWKDIKRSPDLRTVLGRITELKQKDKPGKFDEMQLTKCTDISFYAHYKADYDEFNANAGVMADEVYPASEEEFKTLVDFGHTYKATIHGEWAGVIAFSERIFLGMKTLVVHEELLTRKFRGQGFGAALQRHAIERVDTKIHSLLIGTIHANNTPSLGTATRIGRTDIGGHWFVEL